MASLSSRHSRFGGAFKVNRPLDGTSKIVNTPGLVQ
jgi:hypothetical protein